MVGPTLGEGSMTSLQQVRARREQLLALAARHGARNLRVFGSVARGEADAASDLDLLVDLEPGRSLIDLGSLLVALEAALGCKVDLVTEAGLRPALAQRVLLDAVPL
jgi:predicted nucleotidyltransferase